MPKRKRTNKNRKMLRTISIRIAALCAAVATLFAATMGAASAEDRFRLEIGFVPDLSVAQLFVGIDGGLFEQAGIEAHLVAFHTGDAVVQAMKEGKLDVAYFDIESAMAARAGGVDIKIVASCRVEPVSLIAHQELAETFEAGDPAGGFNRFEKAHGRKPVIATLPAGSSAETAFQHWLVNILGVDPASVEVRYHGAAQAQQALLAGEVDGAALQEPGVSAILATAPDARVIASGADLFPGQPDAVLVARESVIAQNEDVAQALVAAHVAATEKLRADAPESAAHVAKHIGEGRLEVAIVEQAIENSGHGWSADPNLIVPGSEILRDLHADSGASIGAVKLEELFEPRFYDALSN